MSAGGLGERSAPTTQRKRHIQGSVEIQSKCVCRIGLLLFFFEKGKVFHIFVVNFNIKLQIAKVGQSFVLI